jgi:hypothetical protein
MAWDAWGLFKDSEAGLCAGQLCSLAEFLLVEEVGGKGHPLL